MRRTNSIYPSLFVLLVVSGCGGGGASQTEGSSQERARETDPLTIIRAGSIEEIQALIQDEEIVAYRAPEESPYNDLGENILIHAARFRDVDVVRLLLDAGADPNSQSKYGLSPIIGAVQRGHYDLTELLLERGADPNLAMSHASTPLIEAAWARSIYHQESRIIKLLLEYGAEIHASTTDRGLTALMGVRDAETARVLIKAGADPTVRDVNGGTAIHNIVIYGPGSSDEIDEIKEVLSVLLNAGADIDARDNDGNTALHIVALRGMYPAVAQALLDAGADLHVRNNAGQGVVELATVREHGEGVKLPWEARVLHFFERAVQESLSQKQEDSD